MGKIEKDHRLWLIAVVLIFSMTSITQAQSSRIAFTSDREPVPGDDSLNVWISNDDGSHQALFSAEPAGSELRRPSICGDGQSIFYDDSVDGTINQGDIWIKRTSGGGAPIEALHCTNPTGAPTCFGTTIPWCVPPLSPPSDPQTGGPCACKAVDCGPPLSFDPADPRILFEYMNPPGSRHNIVIATWDASSETLGSLCKLTSDGGTGMSFVRNHEPAWCGSNHVVFSRVNHEYENEGGSQTLLEATTCIMKIPTTEPTEIRCHITPDGLDERYPSCGLVNGQWRIAYALQKIDTPSSGSRICTVAVDQNTFEFVPGSEVCTPDAPAIPTTIDWSRPTWSPSGTQIAFAANMDEFGTETTDYNIFRINVVNLLAGTPLFTHTLSPDTDDDPDWGAAVLGP